METVTLLDALVDTVGLEFIDFHRRDGLVEFGIQFLSDLRLDRLDREFCHQTVQLFECDVQAFDHFFRDIAVTGA